MVPAFGAYVGRHCCNEKNRLGVVAPRTADVGFYFGGFAGDFAMHEDVAVGREVRSRGGCEIAAQTGVEGAAVEIGGGTAENEVGRARNITVFEVVAAAVDEKGVLVTEKTAAAENGTVAVDPDREGLAFLRAGGVGDGEILHREIVGVEDHGGRAEGGDGFPVGSGIVVVEIEGQDRFLRVLTDESDEAFLALDVDDFAIRAGLDENGPTAGAGVRELGRGVDGGANGGVVAGAVGGDEGVGLASGVGGEKTQRGGGNEGKQREQAHGGGAPRLREAHGRRKRAERRTIRAAVRPGRKKPGGCPGLNGWRGALAGDRRVGRRPRPTSGSCPSPSCRRGSSAARARCRGRSRRGRTDRRGRASP